jgi:hypothetical protein
MEQAENRHGPGSALRYLMAGDGKGFQISAPDVTCSLAFTANVKSLLSSQYSQMELPPADLLKLEGPATIEGDTLIVSVYNRTSWHVSELAVALTVVKKNLARGGAMPAAGAVNLVPASVAYAPEEEEIRPEKKPDVTTIYRMRAAAPPSATSVFSARLSRNLGPDEEWHWAIVQARGYPPQTYAANAAETATQTAVPSSVQSASDQPASDQTSGVPTTPPVLDGTQNSPTIAPPQNSQ